MKNWRGSALRASYAYAFVIWGSYACGAQSSGQSKEQLAVEIEAEIDRLNSCASVSDCSRVGYPRCRSQYIRAGADRGHLDELLEQYFEGDDQTCDTSCQCALLQCLDGRCALSPGDCNPSTTDGINTCY